jgi:hypothetical protein
MRKHVKAMDTHTAEEESQTTKLDEPKADGYVCTEKQGPPAANHPENSSSPTRSQPRSPVDSEHASVVYWCALPGPGAGR